MEEEHMTHGPAWESEKGTFLRVIVRPGSNQNVLVSEIDDRAVHINLKSSPRKGKANAELVKRLAKTLSVSTADIVLVAGHKSREKTLLIADVSETEVLSELGTVV
jgi:hypothetical protein